VTPLEVIAEVLFWLAAALFVVLIAFFLLGPILHIWRRQRWVGDLIRSALADAPLEESNVRLLPSVYDWKARGEL
jgi:hypothetical protein